MVNTPLDMNRIYTRKRFLEKRKSLNESAKSRTNKIPVIGNNENSFSIRVESYIKECDDYRNAIDLLEYLYEENRFDLLEMSTQKIIHNIIPMVESKELPTFIVYTNSKNIGDINRDRLVESAKIYKSIDRINRNHANISKRFGLENFKGKSDKYICNRICEMVDTYNTSRYIKFNIALEEISYLEFMSGKKMDDSVMVENVLDYFLLIDENSEDDIESYKKAIINSKVINESADSRVKYFTEDNDKYPKYLNDLHNWKTNTHKEIRDLVEMARNNCSDIFALNTIINTLNEYVNINNIEFNTMEIFKEFSDVDGKSARNIMNIIKENKVSDCEDLMDNLCIVWEAELNDTIYDDGTKIPETFTSDEIDKYKLNDLVSDSQRAGEFLDQLEKTSIKESPLNIKRVLKDGESTDINESNLIDYVDDNGYISNRLRSYVFEGSIDTAVELLESSINCINNILYNSNSRCYYTIYENSFDFSIRSRYKVILSEAQENARKFTKSDLNLIADTKYKVNVLESLGNYGLYNVLNKLQDRNYAAVVTANEAALLCEVLAPYRGTENDFIDAFVELCNTEANMKYEYIKAACENTPKEEFVFEDNHALRLEFAQQLLGIYNEASSNDKKKSYDEDDDEDWEDDDYEDDNDDEEDSSSDKKTDSQKKNQDSRKEEKQDPKPEVKPAAKGKDTKVDKIFKSINDAKLAWQGVKAKLKQASAKEQEISRDIDVVYNHTLNSIKNAVTVDHREEIITGQINHSLSRAIKLSIGLAFAGGVGGAAAGGKCLAAAAVTPIIGNIGIFAASKHSSKKEKMMIIDEIDIELKVLEREIDRAQSEGSTAAYRDLLTIQRNLQRKRQEIYRGLAVKGKKIPMTPSSRS